MIEFLVAISFFTIWFVASEYGAYKRKKFERRMGEIAIAENTIANFEEVSLRLLQNNELPSEAKSTLTFIGHLLNSEADAQKFLDYIKNIMNKNSFIRTDKKLYDELYTAAKNDPLILEEFSAAVRDGIIAVMYRWPNQSELFLEMLRKSSLNSQREVDAIRTYQEQLKKFKNSPVAAPC